MSWTYRINTHTLTSPTGQTYSGGIYSGAFGPNQNNAASCDLSGMVGVCPIRPGSWTGTMILNSDKTGPDTIILEPDKPTAAALTALGHVPGSYRMHGDSIANPGHASEGCLIAPHEVRMAFWSSPDHELIVEP